MSDLISRQAAMVNEDIRLVVFKYGLVYRDIARQMGVTPEYLCRILSRPLSAKNHKIVADAVKALTNNSLLFPNEEVSDDDIKRDRVAAIIKMHSLGMSYRAIGNRLGICATRVGQILRKANKKQSTAQPERTGHKIAASLWCPYRVYGEKVMSTVVGEFFYRETFMPCMQDGCPCFHVDCGDAYCDRNGAYMKLGRIEAEGENADHN